MALPPHSAPLPGDSNSHLDLGLVATSYVKERQALERLLASGEFHRSPNLEKILSYLCKQYFLGQGNQIKEYTVATEALARREDFDPKRDSIVRVEMHRLRRRLKEYYAGRGAEDLLRITIPDKSYVPEFVPAQLGIALRETPVEVVQVPALEPQSTWYLVQRQLAPKTSILIVTSLILLLFAGIYWTQRRNSEVAPLPAAAANAASGAAPGASASESRSPAWSGGGSEFRILAGHAKGRYPDRYGVVWQGDDFFTGGKSTAVEGEVHARGMDPNLFANVREGDFSYEIPLSPGVYELTLYFAETSFGEGNVFGGGETTRQFHVFINGKNVLTNFDVLADARDPNTATSRLFKDVRPDKDGKLKLKFASGAAGKAFVNAISLRPGIEGSLRPIRMVCRPHIYRDAQSDLWEPEHYFRGGTQITRPTSPPAVKDPDLFRGERYGKFSYAIPVVPGKYQAKLYFAEYWWGQNRPGLTGGTGSRVFDVFCNFRPLLGNFDILKRNPKDGVAVEAFRGLEPNLDSKLVFDFEPRVNYALLNAIEITEEPSAPAKP